MSNLIEGRLIVKLDQEKIQDILPMGEVINADEGILRLNQWSLPHWDWVESVKPGAVKVSRETAEYIIGRLVEVLPNQKQDVMLKWLNYGWSVNEKLPNWKCQINFYKINYEE